jgi:hypothetical protein
MKRCIYCKCGIPEKTVIEFCEKCGHKTFGEKMFNTILRNMEDAEKRGDLYQ